MTPDLGHFAVTEVIGQDLVVGQLLARPLAPDGNQRRRVLVVGEHIMQLQAESAARQLDDPGEILQHLLYALVVSRDEAPAGVCQRTSSVKNCFRSASMSPRPKAANPSRTRSSFGCAI